MKLFKSTIILLVVLCLLIGAFLFIKYKNPNDTSAAGSSTTATSSSASDVVKIIDADRDKIDEVVIENKNGKYVISRKGQDLVLTYPQNFKVAKNKVDDIILDIPGMQANKVIDEKAKDLSPYGLNTPVATVTIKIKGGTTKVLMVGEQNLVKDSYYVTVKDTNKVYLINNYIAEKFLLSRKDIIDTALYNISTADVKQLSMEKKGKLVFAAKKDGETWMLTAPANRNANDAKITPVIDILAKVTMKELVEENATDLDKYGLKNPSYVLTFSTGAADIKLILGAEKVRNNEIYAKLGDSNTVFIVDETQFTFLDMPLKEFMNNFAYLADIQDVNKIEVTMDGKTTNYEIKDASQNEFTVDGKATSAKADGKSLFRNMYQALIGITASDVETGVDSKGTAEITFTYYLKVAPGTVKIEFIPKDDKYYYVFKNGKYSDIIVAKAKFDEAEGVRDSYKKLMDGINKK